MSSAKLAALPNDVFGQNEVCPIIDNLLREQGNGSKSRYTVIGAKTTTEQHITQSGIPDDIALLSPFTKRLDNPVAPGLKAPNQPQTAAITGNTSVLLHPLISQQPPAIRCPHPLHRHLPLLALTPLFLLATLFHPTTGGSIR